MGIRPKKAFFIFLKINRALKVCFLMRAKLLGQFFLRRSTDDSRGATAWTLSRTNRLKLKRATGPSSFYNNVPQVIMGPRMQIKSLKAFKQFKKMQELQRQSSSAVFKHRTDVYAVLTCDYCNLLFILHIKTQQYWDKNKHEIFQCDFFSSDMF